MKNGFHPYLREVNIGSVAGPERTHTLQLVSRRLAEKYHLPLPDSDPPNSWKFFQDFFATVMDIMTPPAFSTRLLGRPYIRSLFDSPEIEVRPDDRIFVDFTHHQVRDVDPKSINPVVHEILTCNGVSSFGAQRLNDKALLPRLSALGVEDIPDTREISDVPDPKGWVFKPKGLFGGTAFYWEQYPPRECWQDYIAQRIHMSIETFPLAENGTWRDSKRVTDLRFLFLARMGELARFVGCFSRAGGEGSLVANMSSDGGVSSVYFVEDPKTWTEEWNARLKTLNADSVASFITAQATEIGFPAYKGKLVPIMARPRFVDRRALDWAPMWGQVCAHKLWELNKQVGETAYSSAWSREFPWNESNPYIFIGIDTGIEL